MPGFIGPLELILAGVVGLLLFGPKGLGLAARAAGKGMRDVKAAKREVIESVTVDPKTLVGGTEDDQKPKPA